MLRILRTVIVLVAWPAGVAIGCAGQQLYTDLEAHVSGLPVVVAKSHDPTNVLAASLETILHDRSICCGKDSALEDGVARADSESLQDVASKLQGRHLLSDGRPILVTAEFWPGEHVNGASLIKSFSDKHALLAFWNGHLYVAYGVVYRWLQDSVDSGPYTAIHKIELWDTRYADSRREVTFNRETDDPAKVQGFLFLTFSLN